MSKFKSPNEFHISHDSMIGRYELIHTPHDEVVFTWAEPDYWGESTDPLTPAKRAILLALGFVEED